MKLAIQYLYRAAILPVGGALIYDVTESICTFLLDGMRRAYYFLLNCCIDREESCMSLKGNLSKKGNENEDVGFIERLESTIKHLPTSLNEKVVNTLNSPPDISQYLHFFDSTARLQQGHLRQCESLQLVYSRLYADLGEETFVGEWFEVSQDCINQFAEVTGDNQWIHIDQERAKLESPFKTTIGQGFLTLALIPVLTNSIAPEQEMYPEAKMVVNYGLNKVAFPFPVKAGKRIRARSKVIGLTPMKRGLEIVRQVTVEIENSSRAACIAEPVIRLYFDY